MAVISQKVDSRLKLVFDQGQDADGNIVVARKSFNNIKTTATDEQLHTVSQTLVPLQQRVLFKIERNDQSVLMQS